MRERIRRLLPLLWQLTFPLLIYLAITELVFAAWCAAAGQIREEQKLLLTALSAVLALLILIGEYRRARNRYGPCGQDLFYARQKRHAEGKAILWIMLFGIGACLFFNGMLKLLPLPSEGYGQVRRSLYGPTFAVQLSCVGVVIPAIEELIFRGLGYYRLRQEMSAGKAALLTACCFALFHGNLIQGIYAILLGLILAALYEIYDSLWACWLFHGTANLASLILTRFMMEEGREIGVRWLAGSMAVGGVLLIVAGNKISGGECTKYLSGQEKREKS